MRLRAKIGILATAVLVAAGLAIGFMPRAVPVDVAEVKRAPLAVTVEEEGKTRVRERYLVSAPVAGYARRIALDAGDAVAAGQVIAEIEPARSVALDPRTGQPRALQTHFELEIELATERPVGAGGRVYVRFEHPPETIARQAWRAAQQVFLKLFAV